MIPLRNTAPPEKAPLVSWILIVACVIVFLYQFQLGFQKTGRTQHYSIRGKVVRVHETENDRFIQRWGAVPVAVIKGYRPETRRRPSLFFNQEYTVKRSVSVGDRLAPLVSSLFLHGSIAHLLGNMLFLMVFGPAVEGRIGHFRFLLFYLAAGVFASLAHILTSPASNVPIVGASGAISALLGAYFLLFPRSFIVTFVPLFIVIPVFLHIPAVVFIGLWFFVQLTNGFGALSGAGGGIAWWAHIGGFAFGFFVTFWNYRQWRRPSQRYSRAKAM